MANHPLTENSWISILRTYIAYKKTILQERVLIQEVMSSLGDADVELLITDIKDDLNEVASFYFSSFLPLLL